MATMFMALTDKSGRSIIITGESLDIDHVDQIEVHDWHWGLSNTASFSLREQKDAAPMTAVDLLTIDKILDNASVPLLQYCAQGTHIEKGILTCRKNTGDRARVFDEKKHAFVDHTKDSDIFWRVEFEDLKVTSVKWGGIGGNTHGVPETVEFSFLKFHVTYSMQSNDGPMADPKGSRTFQWNIPENKVATGGMPGGGGGRGG